MKNILILSAGDVAGAYEAMYRLSKILLQAGHNVVMLVKHKTKDDAFIVKYVYPTKQIKWLKRFRNRICFQHSKSVKQFNKQDTNPKYSFISLDENSINLDVTEVVRQIQFTPEYIFTGMTNLFCNSTDLKNLAEYTGAQVFNITVDMNHFTGGCHFSWDCQGYIHGCGTDCPAIVNKAFADKAKKNFEIKLNNAKAGKFKIIAGSGHTLKQAQLSKIYKDQEKIENINSLIDTTLLNSKHRNYAKYTFDFDVDKFYILTGAQSMNDPRKGFEYLITSLKILEGSLPETVKNKIVIVVVSKQQGNQFTDINFQKVFLDYMKDYRLLVQLYKAVDLFINTSIEDSGPMMVSEALACGTPVVGFDTGILINMIVNGYNGYKVDVKDSNALADAIRKIVFLDEKSYKVMSENAVCQVENFSSYNYADRILNKLLNETN